MEPLAPALLAALTPKDVEVRFADDRMEPVPYDAPADLVAMSVETYTARRAYQIASRFRERGVPVVMGGFHPTLVPEEAARHAEAVVVGEAEGLWPRLLDDARSGRLEPVYRAPARPSLSGPAPDRSIFAGRRYLPVGLVEAGRGCRWVCEFCSIQSAFQATQTRRPVAEIVDEVRRVNAPLVFFVDDNFVSDPEGARELCRALVPLKKRWVSQASVDAAHDEGLLELMRKSGCQGLLVGFESLDPGTLRRMRKGFATAHGGYEPALANLRRFGLRLYATFIVGYDEDGPEVFDELLAFSERHRFFIAAFNHLTPFPGTPLYRRFEEEGRLLFERWWLDPAYRYGMVPFRPVRMGPEEVEEGCVRTRARFYRPASIARRALDPKVNARGAFLAAQFLMINAAIRREVTQRRRWPLGDEGEVRPLVPVPAGQRLVPSAGLLAGGR